MAPALLIKVWYRHRSEFIGDKNFLIISFYHRHPVETIVGGGGYYDRSSISISFSPSRYNNTLHLCHSRIHYLTRSLDVSEDSFNLYEVYQATEKEENSYR